jgi:plasmid stabilization system protein ParE
MKLVWTDPAVADLQAIHGYISRDSEFYAAQFVESILVSAERLAQFPRLGRVAGSRCGGYPRTDRQQLPVDLPRDRY